VIAVVIGGTGIGYAVHEHSNAQALAAQNAQVTAALNATHTQLDALNAKVDALASRSETPPATPAPAAAPAAPQARVITGTHAAAPHARTPDRLSKLQSQVEAQGKEIEATRNDLESTRGDLVNTRTELTGSIARTHDELVVLEKKGERNYYEFDLQKSKQFQREGPVGISLRKANTKHQYADLQLMVEDQSLTQKHVNLFQPVMFYQSDGPQPFEIVINSITKDRIHGYVSAPKYKRSELTAMADSSANSSTGTGQTQPAPRQKLPMPQ
jgi:hypothetical protein